MRKQTVRRLLATALLAAPALFVLNGGFAFEVHAAGKPKTCQKGCDVTKKPGPKREVIGVKAPAKDVWLDRKIRKWTNK